MTASNFQPQTLRRACQTCARGKRRCDQRWPRCTRCQTRGMNCEYANVPLTREPDTPAGKLVTAPARNIPRSRRRMEMASTRGPHRAPELTIHHPLALEIPKGYESSIISFLVTGVSSLPLTFARDLKTHFIHPELWPCGASTSGTLPPPIRDIHTLCQFFTQAQDTSTFLSLLRQKIVYHYKRITTTSTTNFTDTLASAQALVLAQCMLIATEGSDVPYSETTSTMLLSLGQKLYQQAPIQLPSTLPPRRAWLFAESVRRTIIVAFMLRSVYSLQKRNYSVRTPFVDSLPFDIRTDLWDGDPHSVGMEQTEDSSDCIVSLHQYSGMLEAGIVHGISPFGGLILAACRGKAVAEIAYPAIAG
ncbi:hypothetical protein BDW74DRAFT_188656 [Aspergillus multicolor]|uniref:Zn(II)2Cys6 transcription factor domain-containing protein n=1 Tax=Aspergillus multicolor TaxID=41759 RepID=UPI003CCD61C0